MGWLNQFCVKREREREREKVLGSWPVDIFVFFLQRLNRVAIGIAPVSADEIFVPGLVQAMDMKYLKNAQEIWIKNIFSDLEQELVNKASDQITNELLVSQTSTQDNTFSRLNSLWKKKEEAVRIANWQGEDQQTHTHNTQHTLQDLINYL